MRFALLALALASTAPVLAQGVIPPIPQPAPQPTALPNDIPPPRDTPYPGTIKLTVDATDTARGIFRIKEVIPVASAGRLTLLYPEWLPGNHAPRGPIDDVAGYKFTAGGRELTWKRDPVDVFAIHLDVPAGVTEVTAEYQYLSPTTTAQGRVVMTPDMLNLQWNLVAFYPAGYFTRQIPVDATAILPEGWRYGTALEPVDPKALGTVAFKRINFDDLVDSPMFAGRNFRQEQLTPGVRLNIVADTPEELAATPDQIEKHRELVRQAVKLFGSQHYDHYDFLLAITDKMGGIGLEHHRSSENGVVPGYFTKWADNTGRHNLLPHEYTHSWDGKFRRGADLFTPDFKTPMRNSLLWVYEGQTQFWGYVLQTRSGIVTKEDTLSAYAMIAALHEKRPGRQWRALVDTTNDPIMSARRPQPWLSWQRSEDYYNEGLLIWLDADSKIRELTNGRKSLDDFARAFFGPGDRDWGVSPYTIEDVAKALNGVVAYDWAGFLKTRVLDVAPTAPNDWIARSGYKLSYTATPTAYWTSEEKARKITDLSYSLGMVLDKDGVVTQVIWDGPVFASGITAGTSILAVNGGAFDADKLKAAITAATTSGKPIDLLVKKGDRFMTASIAYKDGLKYPRLEKTGSGETMLDRLLAARK
jgi:predicted metalloprotease with PDZ domain